MTATNPGTDGRDGTDGTRTERKPPRGAGSGPETRVKLMEGALRTLTEQGIAKTSARTIATTAGVNQALVFYHFGSVHELLGAASRHGAEQRVARYREQLEQVTSLSELLGVGRRVHEEERKAGHVALVGQMLAGAQTHPSLGPATAAGLELWITEIEKVLRRVLAGTPLGEFVDTDGLARAVSASFVGIELYEGADPDGTARALDSLAQLADLVTVLEDMGPVVHRMIRAHLRRTVGGTHDQ